MQYPNSLSDKPAQPVGKHEQVRTDYDVQICAGTADCSPTWSAVLMHYQAELPEVGTKEEMGVCCCSAFFSMRSSSYSASAALARKCTHVGKAACHRLSTSPHLPICICLP